jgi:hypothetical protein
MTGEGMPEKSPEQVAVEMAEKILFEIEGKKPKDVTRSEYLDAVAECIRALGGDHEQEE